jgi:TonB family protein
MTTWTLAYLINSAWQIPLIFLAAWLAARTARRSGPAPEHRIWVTALFLEIIIPACSLSPNQILQLLHWTNTHDAAQANIIALTGPAYAHQHLWLPAQLLTLLAIAYACSIAWFAARLVWNLRKTRTLLRNAQPSNPNTATSLIWTRCCNIFSVHDAQLLTSNYIPGPVTIGINRRIILFPASLQQSSSNEDLSAALAHEFAHMRRRDFAKNLLYEVQSLPIAWHPMLWLTRTRIAETREMLCDAMAAEAVTGPENYARSLLRLASLLLQHTPAPTLHAIGIFDANTFERRLMNLTHKRIEPTTLRRLITIAACTAIALATCATALALRVTPPQTPSEPTHTPRVSAGVIAGNRTNFVPPVYPKEAKDRKITGSVILRAIIGKDGSIEKLDVISGPDELRKSALDAVHQWTYKPYLLNGEPTEVDTTITVTYSLAK